ncbi:MAG: dihydrodipicolinate synthase family protein [Balneolaceae bacterium]|nr:dihydrodipicolinate synthase family protein [Balneolaceae bacterium]
MKTTGVSTDDLSGVFAVPPLARNGEKHFPINFERNRKIADHIAEGGITRFLYGGNAFLYHISLSDYRDLLEWLSRLPDPWWVIPSAGPSFGRAMDQAPLLRQYEFPAVMMLPCSDPKTAEGLEQGLRLFAEAARTKLILYLKTEDSLGPDPEVGLDLLARLVEDGICVAIKYAIPRPDPSQDSYLALAQQKIDPGRIISGIGERPAVVHMRDWDMPGFTTGSGCVQPDLCRRLLEACLAGDYGKAESLREVFMPLEDLRDAWNPAIVLHAAVALAGIADTGPVLPFLSKLDEQQTDELKEVARELVQAHKSPIS